MSTEREELEALVASVGNARGIKPCEIDGCMHATGWLDYGDRDYCGCHYGEMYAYVCAGEPAPLLPHDARLVEAILAWYQSKLAEATAVQEVLSRLRTISDDSLRFAESLADPNFSLSAPDADVAKAVIRELLAAVQATAVPNQSDGGS